VTNIRIENESEELSRLAIGDTKDKHFLLNVLVENRDANFYQFEHEKKSFTPEIRTTDYEFSCWNHTPQKKGKRCSKEKSNY
jgi:hypothetical protein